jgi:hypothetical protein
VPPSQRSLPRESWEVVAALLIIALRFRYYPLSFLWHDWVVLVCAWWIFTALGSKTKAWPWVTGAFMAGLLLLYSWGQLPAAVSTLGWGS